MGATQCQKQPCIIQKLLMPGLYQPQLCLRIIALRFLDLYQTNLTYFVFVECDMH